MGEKADAKRFFRQFYGEGRRVLRVGSVLLELEIQNFMEASAIDPPATVAGIEKV